MTRCPTPTIETSAEQCVLQPVLESTTAKMASGADPARSDLGDSMQTDNAFLKKMIDLIPAHFYFEKIHREAAEPSSDTDSEEEHPVPGGKRSSKRKFQKAQIDPKLVKKAKFDPSLPKSVSQIQEERFQEEESKKKKKKKKKSKHSDVTNNPSFRTANQSVEDLRAKLHKKISELKGKRKEYSREDLINRKKLKKERQRKAKIQKDKSNVVKSGRDVTNGPVSGKPSPSGKPIYNKDGKMVFSKFDFSGDKRKPKCDLPTGKNYKQLLEKVTKDKQKLESLRETDAEGAKVAAEKSAWKKALSKAEGVKVKDNPELLKKAIRRKEKVKEQKAKGWEERKQHVEHKLKEKQDKRKKNIDTRKKAKIDNKIKRAKKKGRISGF